MAGSTGSSRGFFATLFDFSFTSFLTLKFLRVIYAALIAVIALASLMAFFAMVMRGGVGIVIALFGVPLVALVYLVLARVALESVALFFRIGENTAVLAGQGRPGPSWSPVMPGPAVPGASPSGPLG